MCRLYGFIATQPAKVECGLVRAQNALLTQSRHDSLGRRHPDGWGLAYYANGDPIVERRSLAAYGDLRFPATAELVEARLVIAHVRAASVGRPSITNTHPFSFGRWAFAHNGTIPRFETVGPRLERTKELAELLTYRRGTTDSELMFLWLLGRIRQLAPDGLERDVPLETIVGAVRNCVTTIESACRDGDVDDPLCLNFILSDGKRLIVLRQGNTAFWVARDDRGPCEVCEVCHCPICASRAGARHEPKLDYRAVVVASEPITGETWRSLPERHLLTVDAGVQRIEVSNLYPE